MTLVLDASMALAWLLKRKDPAEARLASDAVAAVAASGCIVPWLWYSEVGNTVLLAERQRVITAQDSSDYFGRLAFWEIVADAAKPSDCFHQVMHLGRLYRLTAYDAIYLELAIRRNAVLATFDRQLADAAKAAGVKLFAELG